MCFLFQSSANLTDKQKAAEAGASIAFIPYLSVLKMRVAFSRLFLRAMFFCFYFIYGQLDENGLLKCSLLETFLCG